MKNIVLPSILYITIFGYVGCGPSEPIDPVQEKLERVQSVQEEYGEATLEESAILDIVLDVRGGAYAFGFGSGVWYLSKDQGVKLEFEHSESVLDVIPDMQGGAYVNTYIGGLWYLTGTDAKKLKRVEFIELPGISSQINVQSIWPMYQNEIAKRKVTEEEVRDLEEEVRELESDLYDN